MQARTTKPIQIFTHNGEGDITIPAGTEVSVCPVPGAIKGTMQAKYNHPTKGLCTMFVTQSDIEPIDTPPVKPEPPTDVLFRVWKKKPEPDSVMALFPALAGTNDPSTCLSYDHHGQHGQHGQHGSATLSGWLMRDTRPATPKEYTRLETELIRAGYVLNVVKRTTKAHNKAREEQCNKRA